MEYEVEGIMDLGREQRKFSKKVSAPTENAAREKVLSLIGSNHGVKRSRVKIVSVKKR